MKAYKIVMMSKYEIKIDAEELPKVLKAISNNSPAILKQGIFNPNSYSHIIEDIEREKEKEIDKNGHYMGELSYIPLLNIFEGIELLKEVGNYNLREGKMKSIGEIVKYDNRTKNNQ